MRKSRPAGDAALLIDTDVGTDAAARLAVAIAAARLEGVVDVIPAACTVLVIADPGSWDLDELAQAIEALPAPDSSAADGPLVEIPVAYDGPDLADVARLTGLSVAEVIGRHQSAEYTVGWLGFSPGFGYLTGLDPELRGVPRLASPRLRVPAGAVAIAGGMTAVYPAASPGGWRLLGRTSARLWDPGREPPSLLVPGRRVRFRAVAADQLADDNSEPGGSGGGTGTDVGVGTMGRLEVLRPGPLATVQDLGRYGLGGLGVPPSGAADIASLKLGNLLTGNPPGAAGIELTLGRAAFRCIGGSRLAVTGAPAEVTMAAEPGAQPSEIAFGTAFEAADGAVIAIGAPASGLRTYLAVTGGVDVPAVLGSRSSDLHSGLGGGPLRPGTVLPIGTVLASDDPSASLALFSAASLAAENVPRTPPMTDTAGAARPIASPTIPASGQPACLRLVPGPRLDWFDADALAILCDAPYMVTAASNRTGLRLDGPALQRAITSRELDSEGMVTGAVQVPHDGKPILLLADHPTVGGYPVIAVVASADIGLAAQLRPGQQVRFTISR